MILTYKAKITTHADTEDVPCAVGSSKEKSIKSTINVLMDNEVDTLSDMEGNNAMDEDAYLTEMDYSHKDEDVKMSKDSDSTSFVSFHGLVYRKCKLGEIKQRSTALLDSSDEDAVVSDTPLTGPVGATKKMKKAVCLTSSVSLFINGYHYLYYLNRLLSLCLRQLPQ
jgi:hypothetical protein